MSFRKRPRDWERCAEGFEGLDVEERRVKRAKERRSGIRRLYRDDLQQVPSDEEDHIEDSITWTSSEDENEGLHVDLQKSAAESRHRKVTKTHKGQRASIQKALKQRGQPSHYQEENVIVISESDSDSNLDQDDSMKNESEGIELDIESGDSRSSFPPNEKSQNLSQSKNATQASCYSPCISELTSISASTSQSLSPDKGSKVKASQWIKMLDLKTPTKNSQDVPFTELEDSAKKRKKYQKGSLADQLFNLKGREKSMISMIKHQKSTTPKLQSGDSSSKSLTLRITRLESLFSLQLAYCVQQGSRVTVAKEQTALFLQDQQLQEGNVVQVFAPWQQIRLKQSSQLVLLCSNYCIMSNEEPIDALMSETGNTDRSRYQRSSHHLKEVQEVSAVWKCPCVLGLVKSSFACPAHLSPGIPGLYVNKLGNEAELENDDQLSALDTIQATQGPSRKDRLTKSSILEWVDCHDPSARFSGRIHRVFCFNRRATPNEKRYSILIEDSHGTMCQVFCPENFKANFPSVLKSGEGLRHVFGGLTVQYRATRDREPGLFSVIDNVWSGGLMSKHGGTQNTDESIVDSEESSSVTQLCRSSAPGFCYFMKEAENGEGINIEAIGGDSPIPKEKTIRLADVDQADEIKRVSFCCQVLFQLELGDVKDSLPLSDSRRSHKSVLYVTDPSPTNPRYITMTTTAEFSVPESTHLKNKIWKFRDVACQSGKLTCDLYSCIIIQNQENFQNSCNLDLTPIHPGLSVFDLCTVYGSVCDVDENSAYTWDVCDKCQQENLAQDSNSRQLMCLTCQKVVKEPLTRMKLKVYLSVTSSGYMMSSDYGIQSDHPEMKVSVELLQCSIEKILPDSSEAEEGYDIASVLGRTVGPLNCVVLESNREKVTCEMTLKEVNLDLQES